jgi:DNA polymerase-3 subunit epsilon
MALEIADIKWTETGSELVALLLESHEIKDKLPPYNTSQKRVVMPWGIEASTNDKGYIAFGIKELDQIENPLIEFQGRKQARDFLEDQSENFGLCKDINGIIKCSIGCLLTQICKCSGASQGTESPEDYNNKALAFIEKYSLPKSSFIVIEPGRTPHELAAILVAEGEYKGWGYFDSFYKNFGTQYMLEAIKPFADNKDIKRILKGHMQRKKVETILL